MEPGDDLIRRQLKILLLELAARSENPSTDLKELVEEVISELFDEVEEALRKKRHLKIVQTSDGSPHN